MIITAPITDYIPASILTTQGDLVRRSPTGPERVAKGANFSQLISYAGDIYPGWRSMTGDLNHYLKGAGAVAFPAFSALTLRDTGVHIGNDTEFETDGKVISGVGFRPSMVIFLARSSTGGNNNWSVGGDMVGIQMCLYQGTGGTVVGTSLTKSIYIYHDAGNHMQGEIQTFNTDGFTIDFVEVGNQSITFLYLCFP